MGNLVLVFEPTITPATLKKEMQKKFGPYPAEDHSKVGMAPPPDLKDFTSAFWRCGKENTGSKVADEEGRLGSFPGGLWGVTPGGPLFLAFS